MTKKYMMSSTNNSSIVIAIANTLHNIQINKSKVEHLINKI